MQNLSVYVNSEVGVCDQFINSGKKQEISITVSPLKITEVTDANGNTVLKVNSGCNMWKSCENKCCHFALVSHPPLVAGN